MDSIMLGSLNFYRRILQENIFSKPFLVPLPSSAATQSTATTKAREELPSIGHAIAGVMAGSTVSFVAAPIEHIKARLQIQYAAKKSGRVYSGPVDCATKIVRIHQSFSHSLKISADTDAMLVSSPWHRGAISWPVRYASIS